MKKLLVVPMLLLTCESVFALNMSCVSKQTPSFEVVAQTDQSAARLQIRDSQDVLGLRDLTATETLEASRRLRKKETQYGFAKYYAEVNAWQDVEFSVPKEIRSTQGFPAYLTVYMDTGDTMAPGEAMALACKAL